LFLLLSAWVQAAPESDSNPESWQKFERVLVLPAFNMAEIHGNNADLRGPLSGEVFITDGVPPQSIDFFDATLRNRFMRLEGIHLIEPNAEAIASRAGLAPIQGGRSDRIALIQQAGRQSGAEAVLCTYIYAFRERVGTAYGVDSPASISFESILVSVATGRLIWQGSYTETQTTLHQNLFKIDRFIQRKGRWITAKEMAAGAIDEMIQSISELRREGR
jgi:hypothetical protein